MARGPGDHEADATGPHGRGAGPGRGTGTAEAYKDADETAQDSGSAAGLEGKVAGPGGNSPDGSGSKGLGLGAGPGDGREDGTGLYMQKGLQVIHDSHPDDTAKIDSYVSQYYSEATDLELTGSERWDYVLRMVRARLDEEKEGSEAKEDEEEDADSKKGSKDTLERIVGSSDYDDLQEEYGSIYSEYSDVEIDDYVAEYHNQAVEEGYTGQERRAYVREKIKEKIEKEEEDDSEESPEDESEESSEDEKPADPSKSSETTSESKAA